MYKYYHNKYNYINMLNQTGGRIKNYELINLPESKNKLNIKQYTEFEYYGKMSKINYKDITRFLDTIGDNKKNTINKVANHIKKIIIQFMNYYNKNYKKVDSFWLAIRCSKPNNDFDTPRGTKMDLFSKTKKKKMRYFINLLQHYKAMLHYICLTKN